MCRIASLFLLQRLKGSMSGDARDFNNMETITLKEKRRGKVTKGVLVLFLHNDAPVHWALATLKKLAYLGFLCLERPPYSPDLDQSDYHLFPGLEKTIERSTFFFRRGGHCCRADLVGRTTF